MALASILLPPPFPPYIETFSLTSLPQSMEPSSDGTEENGVAGLVYEKKKFWNIWRYISGDGSQIVLRKQTVFSDRQPAFSACILKLPALKRSCHGRNLPCDDFFFQKMELSPGLPVFLLL